MNLEKKIQNYDDIINNIIYDIQLLPIEEIRLSNGVFSNNNIKILFIFKCDKLKILYLNGNNLHSLEFVVSLK